jgi:hypothetical protein
MISHSSCYSAKLANKTIRNAFLQDLASWHEAFLIRACLDCLSRKDENAGEYF